MKWLIERSRYLALIGVCGLLVCTVTAFALGVYKTFRTVVSIALQESKDDFALILLFDCLEIHMKNLFALILYLFAFQIFGNAQTNTEILPILRERVEVGRVNQSNVVSIIEEKGVRFTSLGKASRKPDAKNVDENTVFEIGSVTKVFTGTLLAEAVRRGEVKLDDPVSKYLPATVKTPTRNGIEITLLELATHTSGLPRLPANFAPL